MGQICPERPTGDGATKRRWYSAAMTEYVTIREIADALGKDRSSVLKRLKKEKRALGIEHRKMRTSNSRGQLTVVVSRSDADRSLAVT